MANEDFDRILIIAAHPDDEIIGCGGILNKFANQNKNIRIVFMSEGVTSRFSKEDLGNKELIKEKIAFREKCALNAIKKLGIESKEIFFNKRKCCQLDQYPKLELTKEIESHIRNFDPTCLITHFENDTNIDHRICYEVTLPAIRPKNKTNLKIVLSFEILSSSEWNYPYQFNPNFFFDITNEIEKKLECCSEYIDEIKAKDDARSLESLRALAFLRGNQAGYKYAEGFKLIVKR